MPIATYLLLPWFANCGSTAAELGRNNGVWLTKIYIPGQITVQAIVIIAAQADSGKHWGIGLYDLSGNLVLDSGPATMSTSGTNELLTTTITPVLVTQDTYWLAVTTDSGTASIVGASMTLNANSIACKGTSIVATAANSSSGGQLPSTTGVITLQTAPAADQFAPFVKLQA